MSRGKYLAVILFVATLCFASCKTSSRAKKGSTTNRPAERKRPQGKDKEQSDFELSFENDSQPNKKKEKPKASGKEVEVMGFRLTSKDNVQLYRSAAQWIGTPHKYGGCSKTGIDCSCFVLTVFKEVYGIDLPRSSSEMAKVTSKVDKERLKEGDLLFFKTTQNRISHVGIYLKDNKFVHTSNSKGVTVSDLDETYWKRTFFVAGRHKSW